jgi:hypothetical protein
MLAATGLTNRAVAAGLDLRWRIAGVDPSRCRFVLDGPRTVAWDHDRGPRNVAPRVMSVSN